MSTQFNYDSAEQMERVQTAVAEIKNRLAAGERFQRAIQNIPFLEDSLTGAERLMVLQHFDKME